MSTLKEFLDCMFEDKPARNKWYRDTNAVYGRIANGFIERDERKDERIKELEALILSADAEILKLEDHISELEASSGCLREALQLLQHESLNYHSGQIVDKALKGG